MIRTERWDGPLWGFVILFTLFASALGCFGVAIAESRSEAQAEILTTDYCPPPADLL